MLIGRIYKDQKNDAPPHLKRWGLNRLSFFGCSRNHPTLKGGVFVKFLDIINSIFIMEYSRKRLYELAKANLNEYCYAVAGSFIGMAGLRLFGGAKITTLLNNSNPLEIGIGVTTFIDLFQIASRQKTLVSALKDDFGSIFGQYVGISIANLLI